MAETSLPEGVTLVDAFPFDSNPNLITDVNGYLRGDRSVDAWTMRNVFRQFFSDGVFGNPANALQIAKASTGLAVTIQPGMFVIQGGMGGIKEDSGPLTLTLDTGTAAGNVCYGIMLRYDDNPGMRGLGFRVVKGTASSNPQPPEPDQTSENVMEYRLGYVTVSNGSVDLSNATVTNEKGLSVCPYASPFDKIDVSGIVSDVKNGGVQALQNLLAYFDTYKDAIDAALSDEEATYLQQQINQISEQIGSGDLSGQVDGASIIYDTKLPSHTSPVLQVNLDKYGGAASTDTAQSIAGDLATIAYQFHRTELDGLDLDSIVTFEFPNDVTSYEGNYDSGQKRYYANQGSGA